LVSSQTQKTVDHINRVGDLLEEIRDNLSDRASAHDASKFKEPEVSAFDNPELASLSTLVYGSPEYKAQIDKLLGPALEHHYANNSHHPEHYSNGVKGMSLLDIIEMLADWKASSERMSDGGDILKSITINKKRFNHSAELAQIFRNTAKELGWVQTST
jgi:uncharacterized protein DUF5662